MLYLFTGNSSFLLREQINTWRNIFIEKYTDLNFSHLKDLIDINNNSLSEVITGRSFLDQKRLVIIDNLPLNSKVKDARLLAKQDFVINTLDKIPEDNIVVFSSINPDKRSKLYKELVKKATVKDFSIKGEFDIKNLIQKRYNNKVDIGAINLIIKYKSGNLDKIINEIDKLLIGRDLITKKDIEDYIFPELEESIFLLLDDLLNLNVGGSIKKINIMLDNSNMYLFYNNLIANVRTQVYIIRMKKSGVIRNQIITDLKLGNRSFLLDRNYKISYKGLSDFYIKLIDLDKKMKSGKMIGNKDSDFKFELERVILSLVHD